MCLSFPGQGNGACNAALHQMSDQSQTTSTINLLESFGNQQLKNKVDDHILAAAGFAGYTYNTVKNRQIIAQLPINPLNTEFSINLTEINKSYSLKWKIDF